jgi:RNA polymerase sigma-70 factor (ECF subfamily)
MALSRNSTLQIVGSPASEEALHVPDDAELLRQIGRGDENAFRELVNRHSRYLYGIAFSLTQNTADAEDVVQETFVAVLKSKFREESSARTWLVQILVRQAALVRRIRSRKLSPAAPDEVRNGLSAAVEGSAAQGSAVSGSDAKLDLAVMLETLSPEHRQVIVLREIEGMTYDEMAQALKVPRGTVESRLFRARAELKERFKGYLKRC